MTSKEIVLNEIKRLEHNLKIYEKENMTTQIEYAKTNILVNNLILKDLERLEKQDKILNAFKNYIKISSDGIISCHDFILIPIFVSKEHEEQYNLLKEWLNNGK